MSGAPHVISSVGTQPSAEAPRVSVVMATHHRPDLLRRAMESLLAQDYPAVGMELIVVACAGDEGIELVRELADGSAVKCRCEVLPDTASNRLSAAAKRNAGARVARGEWLAFMDDDCVAERGWISGAAGYFDNPRHGAIEGAKVIPPLDPPTVTHKGLRTLAVPGGYQTCNIFYRRALFEKIGGFDPAFPFYLEDSDLAWTVLDAGFAIPHAAEARVVHPTPEARPMRMLHDARRANLLPYLYKKHPERFMTSGIRAMRRSHWVYLALYAACVAAITMRAWPAAVGLGAAIVLLLALHNASLFRGCRVTIREWALTNVLLPILPVVKVVQLVRGNVRNGVWLWS